MMKRWPRWLTLLAAVAVALAGCRPPQSSGPDPVEPPPEPPPVVQQPQPDSPEAPPLPPGCHPYSSPPASAHAVTLLLRSWILVTEGECRLLVGEQAFQITFRLPSGMTEDALLSGLTVQPESALAAKRLLRFDAGEVLVQLRRGKPGELVEVRWQGDVGGSPLDFGFAFERLSDPTVIGEIRVGDGPWQPWTDVLVVEAQPLTFRFRTTGGLPVSALTSQVERALKGSPATVRLVGEETVEVTVPTPPPLLAFEFSYLEAPHSRVQDGHFTVYTGGQPQLIWLDPASGEESPLGPAPADVQQGFLSPDGRWAMLTAYGAEHIWRDRIFVVETLTGQRWPTPFAGSYWQNDVYWLPGLVIKGAPQAMQLWRLEEARAEIYPSKADRWGPLSPDGRYLPGYVVHMEREDPETWLAPTTILLFDVKTGTERAFPDLIRGRVPHGHKPFYVPLSWSEDGSFLLVGEAIGSAIGGQAGPPGFKVWRLDPATGALADHGDPLPQQPSQQRLTGSGGWQFSGYSRPNGIRLKAPDGTERQYEGSLVVGWAPDGRLLIIRWAQPMEHRRERGGI